MLKLYTARNSICTQKVFITLAEKELDYGVHEINLFTNEQYRPEYLAINPKGVVPALDHDGRIITESTLICEYLDEMFPSPALTPSDPYLRTRMRKWSKAVDEELFEATRELSFSAMFREKMRLMTPEQREGRFHNVGDPVKRARFKSTYEDGVESLYVFQGIAAFEVAFRDMESALSEGTASGRWLAGENMTLADINMMPFVARLSYLDLLPVWIEHRPGVQVWWQRVQALPSFSETVPGRLKDREINDMREFGAAIRKRVAERREEYLGSRQQKG
ncbi:MAG: glutathione S-transferase family protein [Hyphomicrobiaceae bacterium]